jgi:hypothetical protein
MGNVNEGFPPTLLEFCFLCARPIMFLSLSQSVMITLPVCVFLCM